jgi:hypothetical protein
MALILCGLGLPPVLAFGIAQVVVPPGLLDKRRLFWIPFAYGLEVAFLVAAIWGLTGWALGVAEGFLALNCVLVLRLMPPPRTRLWLLGVTRSDKEAIAAYFGHVTGRHVEVDHEGSGGVSNSGIIEVGGFDPQNALVSLYCKPPLTPEEARALAVEARATFTGGAVQHARDQGWKLIALMTGGAVLILAVAAWI